MKRTASKVIVDLAVYEGRQLLGHVLEMDDGEHQAVTVDGEIIGSFRSRIEASKAISGVAA
ncbi:hypothetical protein NB311A_05008 [Nitrobacter sp. Nb-311A]|uniref:hypothetical protein n=1 Tax=Nitrobacter sp. Nb-311A TaxID=314253 RepID=UPI00006870B6|nr:hypothetical protein [Nitrobacter sp. Nb-311A]EAQ35748.1 hypothetical protein NB311A_05008 [Nitrobacter sp. Nb-311A]